ncbi:MAG: hypothetical protein B9J98_02870 [Candidatus Terraquivivens tikiterensis]|uniref:Cas12f1-like TNB domain-containing protein n=1 Tax=Candidatus Terraquivivens tikiterensis TaxID=1980982 RepID=A0A2R7Y674_9ARCH|nr:MAG: hypothetical protein B9J98_02870 [Candidatus Terraquivivens tikiterensis]
METVEVGEHTTSKICPRCKSDHTCKHKRLFKCLNCGLEAHRDAVGVINMAPYMEVCPSGVVAHRLLLRRNGMGWEGRSPMNNKHMRTLEARIPYLSKGVSKQAYPEHRLRKRSDRVGQADCTQCYADHLSSLSQWTNTCYHTNSNTSYG